VIRSADQQAASRGARAANRAAFRDEDGVPRRADVNEEELPNAVVQRLQGYMSAMTKCMLEQLDSRLPVPVIATQLRKIYDFRRMPFTGDPKVLEEWSNAEIDAVVKDKFAQLDTMIVKDQALKVRLWLREHHDSFLCEVPMYNSDGDAMVGPGKKPILKKELKICGSDSIMETLFTKYDTLFPSGINQYLEIVDYMISYKVHQSDTERVGRDMALTKTRDRASMSGDNFKCLVWLSFNAPPIHQIDFMPIVEQWIKEGHRLATFKEGGCPQVLERLSSKNQVTLLK
jgi:hypothetical protein